MFGKAMTKETINPTKMLKELNFCVFDLETTGGNHKNDKIIEIGLVKVQNLKIVDQKNYLIQPEIHIPEFIQKLTSITPKDVKNSPVIEDVVDEILEFMGDAILVAHNTSFDVPFFNSVLRRMNREELPNKSICTNLMTKYLIPNLMNSNLNYMSKIFKIDHTKAHRALDDALATAELFLKYLQIFIDKGIQKVNHLYYPRNRYELDRINFKKENKPEEVIQKLKNIKSPSLFTLKGDNGVILYAIPCKGSDSEKELILSKLKSMPWEIATIQLIGPFIEGLVNFNNVFSKIEVTHKVEIIKFLWKEHLKNKSMPHKATEDNEHIPSSFDHDFGDFIVTNHLVPEQFIIYPLSSLHQTSELIFRFPGHKKKLLQYISSKSAKIKNNKIKKIHFHPLLKNFIEEYIKDCKATDSELYIFSKKLPAKKPDDFLSELDVFLSKNPNPYHYPADYI